jgi:hypothetical protein
MDPLSFIAPMNVQYVNGGRCVKLLIRDMEFELALFSLKFKTARLKSRGSRL